MSDEAKADQPRCYYGGGADDHAWMVTNNGRFLCRDCPAELDHEEVLRKLHEYDTIVKTGISVLIDELEAMREDVRVAAGSLAVSLDEARPGTTVRRLLIANRMLINERDTLRARAAEAEFFANEVRRCLDNLINETDGPDKDYLADLRALLVRSA